MLERFLNPPRYPRGTRRALLALLPGLLVVTFGVANTLAPAQTPPAKSGPLHPAPKPNPRIKFVIQMQAPVSKQGVIVVELLPKDAPKTVAHILALVNKKFYDRVLFHRVITVPDPYIAQAGDPKSKSLDGAKIKDLADREVSQKYELGLGGSGSTVPLEQGLPHLHGTLALARSSNIDSGDSQFFFNLKDNHNLDGAYCVFGRVVQGQDIMDKIQQGDRILTIRLVSAAPAAAQPKHTLKK